MYIDELEGAVLLWTPSQSGLELGRFQATQRAEVEALNEAARDEGGHVQWFVGGTELKGSVYEPGLR